jgi:hypothetical protein
MQPAVARITSPSVGTAFAVDARTALTAWHCVADPDDSSRRVDDVRLRFLGSEETSAKVGPGDPDQDWTILELAAPPPASLRPLPLGGGVKPWTECSCLGFPRLTAEVGFWPVLATVAGETEREGQPLLAIQARLESEMDVRGLSGGPVVPRGASLDEAAGLVVRRLIEPEEGKPVSSLLVACPVRLFAAAATGAEPGPITDEESAQEALAAAARAGDVNAAARLGHRLLAEGKRDEAEPWLRQAGLGGEPTAAFAVGMLIDPRGELVQTDPERAQEALVWFRRAATAGDIYGTTTMGIRLRQHGRSDAALPWLEEGVDRGGDAMAAHTLARIYEERGETARAERWERFSAEQGDVRAAYDLGRMLNARGERDEAILWLRRATIDPDAVRLLRELGVEPEADRT